jgi:RNA polymerase sigma-70 factor, ECF subfamily
MVDCSQLDDHDLLKGMLEGSEQAFIELYRRRQAGIYRFALRLAGSSSAAEDALQETFLVLMRRAASYDPARGSVSAFLYGIARNCVRRGRERAGALVTVSDEEMQTRIEEQAAAAGTRKVSSTGFTPASSVVDVLSREQEVEALRRAILTLPEHYRSAVVLCDLEELSYEEAAAALGCAVGTVRSRLHRGRNMLCARLRSIAQSNTKRASQQDAKLQVATTAEPKAGSAKKHLKQVECEA